METPRSISSAKPFGSKAREYIQKGWSVVPLPERRKEWPPVGYTGRAGKFADDEDINNWLDTRSRGNIALRVGNMLSIGGSRYEVVGIDVDDHSGKHGADELRELSERLGPLPDTWTSSSRSDGNSGIRFYLVPYGYGFKGQASGSIDIVQRVHRYAVCYPSWHPDTKAQYFWYEPGVSPDGQSFTHEIPEATRLPELPDPWVSYLTAGKQLDSEGYGIDLDTSNDDLKVWANKHFCPPLDGSNHAGGMCDIMARALSNHCDKINGSPSNHDKLIKAHWHLLTLAAEGHSGWKHAIKHVNEVWQSDILAKGKRSESMVKREILRSYWATLRKIKAKADSFKEQGLAYFSSELCMLGEWKAPKSIGQDGKKKKRHWIYEIPIDFAKHDPVDFACNDVLQARHFRAHCGSNIRYLSDYNAWIIYDGTRWHIDEGQLIRDLFDRTCVRSSERRLKSLIQELAKAEAGITNASAGVESAPKGGLRGGVSAKAAAKAAANVATPNTSKMKAQIKQLATVVDRYRHDNRVKAMLNCLKSMPGISMQYSMLNYDTTIVAMPNGKCIKLEEPTSRPRPHADGFKIVDNRKEYYTTMSTAVEYTDSYSPKEMKLWREYLDIFLPDRSYRKFVQKALGYILLGGNPDKLALFLVGQSNTGKSTMLQAIQGVLNDYGATFQPNAIFKDTSSGNNPELGNLLHKRGIFSSESGSQRIYANPLKRNTGGDKISVTRKYANAQIIGIPHFTPVVATNQSPSIEDADEALIKRILVLPFTTCVSEMMNDKRADVTLARDAKHAIFNWLVRGYRLYIQEGLAPRNWHPLATTASSEFASDLNDLAAFLHDVLEVASTEEKSRINADIDTLEHEAYCKSWTKVSKRALYDAYQNYCGESGQKPLTPIRFGKKVDQIFDVKAKKIRDGSKTRDYYVGLRWRKNGSITVIGG